MIRCCPFCGANGRLDRDSETELFGVEAEHARGCILMDWDFRFFSTEADALAAWNRRAEGSQS